MILTIRINLIRFLKKNVVKINISTRKSINERVLSDRNVLVKCYKDLFVDSHLTMVANKNLFHFQRDSRSNGENFGANNSIEIEDSTVHHDKSLWSQQKLIETDRVTVNFVDEVTTV